MIEVAKLAMSVDPAQQVHRAFGRVSLSELDARRHGSVDRHAGGGINFYLMSALDRSTDVPEDAIVLIKRIVGRAFRANADRWKALFRTHNAVASPWALLESHGHNIKLRAATHGSASSFLSYVELSSNDRQRALTAATDMVRILLEYAPVATGRVDESWASLERSLEELATTEEAAEAATRSTVDTDDGGPRGRILAHALTADDVLQATGRVAEDAKSWASRERRADRLFGVWSRTPRAFVHPDFQFHGGKVHPRLPELLQVLRTRVGFDPVNKDKGGWARAYWLYQPHPGLSAQALAAAQMDLSDTVTAAMALGQLDDTARSPAEVFEAEPDAVIALAKELADGGATA